MKAGLTTSVILHAALIGFGLWRRRVLGLHPVSASRTLLRYAVFAVVWIPLAMVVYPIVVRRLGFEFTAQASLRYFAEPQEPGMLALVVLVACVLAPVGEELFFRGFLWNLLEDHFDRITALVGARAAPARGGRARAARRSPARAPA